MRSTTTTIPERIQVLRASSEQFIPSSDVVDLLLDLRNDADAIVAGLTPVIDELLGTVSHRSLLAADEDRGILDSLGPDALARPSITARRVNWR